jgi:hypothetical protein
MFSNKNAGITYIVLAFVLLSLLFLNIINVDSMTVLGTTMTIIGIGIMFLLQKK